MAHVQYRTLCASWHAIPQNFKTTSKEEAKVIIGNSVAICFAWLVGEECEFKRARSFAIFDKKISRLSMSQFQVDSVDTTDVPNALHEHSKTTSYYVSVEDYILIHQDSQPLPQPSLSLPLSQPQSLLSPPPLNSIVQIIFFIRFLSIAWFSWILLKKM